MYLVDTSAWIAHFSKKDTFDLRQVCPPEERVMCLPVYQEILQGIREESQFRDVRVILDAAVMVGEPLDRSLFLEAVALFRTARRQGLTVRSSIDCQIAALAVRHNLVVVHRDRDYPHLAKISNLHEMTV
ncbi:MAG: PIN domain-containing protein [Spirochaetales bacterium]